RPALVEALGFARQRKLAALGARKLAGARDPSRVAVDPRRRLHEELHQRGMRARTRHERRGARDQRLVARRHVARESDDAAAQLRELLERRLAVERFRLLDTVEEPYRLVEEAAQRNELHLAVLLVERPRRVAGAALHESEVDARLDVVQQLQVLARAARGLQ